ncbi:MAG TPA: hypothetical protein VNW97_17995 [Candidatus Saccharimonadales bacterium]|jgi:hypothetical protein|nr:hypothetical protein [Candidatus Saccharimonadales bacterium]
MMTALLSVWAGLTIVLVVLLIYRSTLNMHEDDQLFLDEANSHLAREQEELTIKMNRLQPWVRIFGACSALLILVMAGVEIYSQVSRPLP